MVIINNTKKGVEKSNMSSVIDFLMKTKNSDGTYDILHPITKTANVKTSEEIPVMLTDNIGSYSNGDIISAGTSIDSIVRKLVQVQIPPVYTAPSVSVAVSSGTAGGSYEEGTTATPTITATFTKNDAGSLNNIIIKKNGAQVATSTSSPASHTETITITGSIKFSATATYAAGLIKKDNFGEDYPTGAISAGSKDSSEITYSGYRKYFWGSDSVTTAPASSGNIRSLTNSSSNAASQGRTFTLSVTKGQTRAIFAYPANIRDVSSVKYVEMGNDESKALFEKTVIPVEGANGFTAIDYKVYTLMPAQPFPSDMTFSVTI